MGASRLRVTVWSFERASRISAIYGFCEEEVAKFHNIVNTIFIDSNTFKGNFIGNTSSDVWHSTFWVQESHLAYSTRMIWLLPLELSYVALSNLVGTSHLLCQLCFQRLISRLVLCLGMFTVLPTCFIGFPIFAGMTLYAQLRARLPYLGL